MKQAREFLVRQAAARGKYSHLYHHLSTTARRDWKASFGEIENILGFELPPSARLYRPWWANQTRGGGHSHALAWQAAGWKTRDVDLEAETLVFERTDTVSGRPAAATKEHLTLEAVAHGKYAPLYRHLLSFDAGSAWSTTFAEVEKILDFRLPASARIHRPWWANQRSGGHSHALAWQAAGWKTKQVDLEAETLVFERVKGDPASTSKATIKDTFDIDRDFPATDMGPWPEGFTAGREQIYDDVGPLSD